MNPTLKTFLRATADNCAKRSIKLPPVTGKADFVVVDEVAIVWQKSYFAHFVEMSKRHTSAIILSLLIFICLQSVTAVKAVAQAKSTLRYLALGDSYTIGEAVSEAERWPVLLASSMSLSIAPTIIATTGWRTDDLMSAIQKASLQPPYDMVSLLIGVNNQYQGRSVEAYKPEFEALLNKAIELAGNDKSKVFVVSIPDYGYTPFGKPKQLTISRDIDAFNAANQAISERLGVRYVNITDISRLGFENPSLVAADGLHPSGAQYKRWVERIREDLKK